MEEEEEEEEKEDCCLGLVLCCGWTWTLKGQRMCLCGFFFLFFIRIGRITRIKRDQGQVIIPVLQTISILLIRHRLAGVDVAISEATQTECFMTKATCSLWMLVYSPADSRAASL